MVVEWLKVRVPHEQQAAYLEADARIWTSVLARQPGFLEKHVWRDADDPDAVILVIHWRTLAQWKTVPGDVLADCEKRFQAALGQAFAFLEEKTFEVMDEQEHRPTRDL